MKDSVAQLSPGASCWLRPQIGSGIALLVLVYGGEIPNGVNAYNPVSCAPTYTAPSTIAGAVLRAAPVWNDQILSPESLPRLPKMVPFDASEITTSYAPAIPTIGWPRLAIHCRAPAVDKAINVPPFVP